MQTKGGKIGGWVEGGQQKNGQKDPPKGSLPSGRAICRGAEKH